MIEVNGTDALQAAGQRLWLDTLSRRLLESGTLARYLDQYGVTGVTSNPTILSKEIRVGGYGYDARAAVAADPTLADPERLVYTWAVADAQAAADLLRPMWEASSGMDGWVSIEIPPGTAYQADASFRWGRALHALVDRPNVFIKVPATPQGAHAIEELVVAGIPVNATLVFDVVQHQLVAASYLRGLERRRAQRLPLRVASVASVFVSRWDQIVNPFVPTEWQNWAGLSLAHEIQEEHWQNLSTRRWSRLAAAGADTQRIVWASTSAKSLSLPATYYAERLPLRGTINTMPETTLLAVADADMSDRGTPARAATHAFRQVLTTSGIDTRQTAETLQQQGVVAFASDWARLLDAVATQSRPAATRESAA